MDAPAGNNFAAVLNSLESVIEKHGFEALKPLQNTIVGQLNNAHSIDIAVFGQFNTGKSSFLNSIIGKTLLPAGVLPLTSVITYLQFGVREKITITRLDHSFAEIGPDEMSAYVSEKLNPGNIRQIKSVHIETPQLKEFPNIRLVDTPGIGSLFTHNSETSRNWFPIATVAIYAVSAERPLSASDLDILEEIQPLYSRIVLLLTKTDLYETAQVEEIKEFIERSLLKRFDRVIHLYEYSVIKETSRFRQNILENLFYSLNQNVNAELEKSIGHKLHLLHAQCFSYLGMAYHASLKSEAERIALSEYITREAGNIQFIYKELMLVSQMYINQTRAAVHRKIEAYKESLTEKTIDDFLGEYNSWHGNLSKVSRMYEAFLRDSLQGQLQQILASRQDICYEHIETASTHLLSFTRSFRNRLFNQIYESLGMQTDLAPEIPMKTFSISPDISISRAFDSHIDTLWFLIPMGLLRKYFMNYFLRQIPGEVEKNIYRLTSDLTEKINNQIFRIQNEVLQQLLDEVKTLEHSLSSDRNQTTAIRMELQKLEGLNVV